METCQTLLKRDLRRNLFTLFTIWSGKFGLVGHRASSSESEQAHKKCTELQFAALQAMSALLCCGPCFDSQGLADEGSFYSWLDMMLESNDEKAYIKNNLHLMLLNTTFCRFIT